MDIRFICDKCGQKFVVDDTAVGCVYSCPQCRSSVTVPQVAPPSAIPPVAPVTTQPSGKRRTVLAGWICFSLGAVAMLIPGMRTSFIYTPLFLASFVLAIVALVQKRVAAGVTLLLASFFGPPIIFVISLFFGMAAFVGGSMSMMKDAQMKMVAQQSRTVTATANVAAPATVANAGGAAGLTLTNAVATVKVLRYAEDKDQHAKDIPAPTAADIQQAVLAVSRSKDEGYLTLEQKAGTFIQLAGDLQGGFILEYQDDDGKPDGATRYRANRSVTADEVVKALISYASGTEDWKKIAEWDLQK